MTKSKDDIGRRDIYVHELKTVTISNYIYIIFFYNGRDMLHFSSKIIGHHFNVLSLFVINNTN